MLSSDIKTSMTILIVDDEPKNIQLLGNLLRQEHYQIQFALNAEEVFEWVKSETFDLILLDIMMPGMNGIQVCQRLKQHPAYQEVPIIFLTADTSEERVLEAFDAGAVDYVTKPFKTRELLSRVSTHLQIQDSQKCLKQTNASLEQALSDLENKHRELQQAQSQLIQSEKMASLGGLVAGVAHEINNPTNFAYTGTTILQTRVHKLEAFLYELAGDDLTPELKQMLAEQFTPLYSNLETVREGTERIKNIVRDLQAFSSVGESESKTTSIVEGLTVTLGLVHSRYNYINFIRNFEESALVECNPGQLNQVFMNLAINACHAIEERHQNEEGFNGEFRISTVLRGEYLGICFSDNGCGMPEELQQKIFEPFFTTKSVGTGTGLGLSITYGIIEKHGGKIEVNSVVGKGTTFTVLLPISSSE